MILVSDPGSFNRFAYTELARSVTSTSSTPALLNDGDIEIIEPVPDSDEAINFASFSRPPLKPLVRADYPKVTYWHKHEWMSASKAMKADADDPNKKKGPQTNGNTTMMYVEDKDGNCIDGHRAKEIRAVVTQFWLWLKKVNQLPRTWTQLDLKLSDLYRLEMAYRFPELQLCEGGWKADMIAIHSYSQWYGRSVVQGPCRVKKEAPNQDMLVAQLTSAKRQNEDPDRLSSEPPKKPRLDPPQHSTVAAKDGRILAPDNEVAHAPDGKAIATDGNSIGLDVGATAMDGGGITLGAETATTSVGGIAEDAENAAQGDEGSAQPDTIANVSSADSVLPASPTSQPRGSQPVPPRPRIVTKVRVMYRGIPVRKNSLISII